MMADQQFDLENVVVGLLASKNLADREEMVREIVKLESRFRSDEDTKGRLTAIRQLIDREMSGTDA